MTNQYHTTVEPPYRIQKRLVLNQCFKTVLAQLPDLPAHLTYITFGGAELYDVIDLVCVFDIRKTQISAISFEMDAQLAAQSRQCAVADALSQMSSFSLRVIPHAIQDIYFGPILERRSIGGPSLFFLDYTDPNGVGHRDTLVALLAAGCLRAGDFVLVTSCLTPRVLHQDDFMKDFISDFCTFFHVSGQIVDRDFKVRNHVDLLVAQAMSENAKSCVPGAAPTAELLQKYRYRDTRAPMGVWLYAIKEASSLPARLPDIHFDEYPWTIPPAVTAPEVEEVELFDDI